MKKRLSLLISTLVILLSACQHITTPAPAMHTLELTETAIPRLLQATTTSTPMSVLSPTPTPPEQTPTQTSESTATQEVTPVLPAVLAKYPDWIHPEVKINSANGKWEVVDTTNSNKVIFEYNRETSSWKNVRPYYMCGDSMPRRPQLGILDNDGNKMPTGMTSDIKKIEGERFGAMACLTKIETDIDGETKAVKIDGKEIKSSAEYQVVFFDKDGNPHFYNIAFGAFSLNGNKPLGGICLNSIDDNNIPGNLCTSYSATQFGRIANYILEDPSKTKMIDLRLQLKFYIDGSPIGDLVNNQSELNTRLYEAIQTGTNFPDANENEYLWGVQIEFIESISNSELKILLTD